MKKLDKETLIRVHKDRSYKIPYETFENYARMVHGVGRSRAYSVVNRRRLKHRIGEGLRWEIWERDNFTCLYCGSRRFLHVDHILPESLGGETIRSNLQTLCRRCNLKKGTTYEDFIP